MQTKFAGSSITVSKQAYIDMAFFTRNDWYNNILKFGRRDREHTMYINEFACLFCRFWSELCVCVQVGTLFRALRTVNKRQLCLIKKSMECVSNNWDLLMCAFKVGVIPQNITIKEKFESCGIWFTDVDICSFWM